MFHRSSKMALIAILTALLLSACQTPIDAPSKPNVKLYVFDCGSIKFDDVSLFGLSNDDTLVREMFVPCYLIDHPQGQLLFDAGLPPSSAGQGIVEFQPGTTISYERSLQNQLADMSIALEDIELVAFSHMHFDHAGSANLFTNSKILMQQAEYSSAFENADDYPYFDPKIYGELANSEFQILNGDHDVFGDGSVMLISAPGHTPGHQVLFVDLVNYGPLILSGDLYHFEVSRSLRRVPGINTDKEETLRSMIKIEAMLKQKDARLWIEHNKALADTLRKAPSYYD